jgi:metal-responsive CopG/Arc/MetJ family transcriptional regulator
MAPARKIATFRLDDDLVEGLKAVHERDGVPPSEQVRRAVRAWLEQKGAVSKVARKRAPSPRRA